MLACEGLTNVMTRILGVDPGSRITGYGLIETGAGRGRMLLADTIRPGPRLRLPDRLHFIYRRLAELLEEHRPDVAAVETAFYHKSARSALVLGQVRGVVLVAVREAGIEVHEYAPREIKMAVTGNGNASKDQVGFMVRSLLGLGGPVAEDAADALAAALCHWHRNRGGIRA